MWPDPKKTADLVTFTEEMKSLMENFCVEELNSNLSWKSVMRIGKQDLTGG